MARGTSPGWATMKVGSKNLSVDVLVDEPGGMARSSASDPSYWQAPTVREYQRISRPHGAACRAWCSMCGPSRHVRHLWLIATKTNNRNTTPCFQRLSITLWSQLVCRGPGDCGDLGIGVAALGVDLRELVNDLGAQLAMHAL